MGPRMGPTKPVVVNRGRPRVRNMGLPISFSVPPARDQQVSFRFAGTDRG